MNGETLEVEGIDPHTTLLDFLRDRGLVGTKEGCAEGECGACAVVVLRLEHEGPRYVAVNACLTLVGSVLGAELRTVEGLSPQPGSRSAGRAAGPSVAELHPVQRAMVELGGSQCGYCTPGFVVSMFAEYYRREASVTPSGEPGVRWDPESVAGNLCRCTGYRPIREAMRSLPLAAEDDDFRARLSQPLAPLGEASLVREDVPGGGGTRRLHRPASLAGALALLAKEPAAKLIAGGTDLVVEVNQRDRRWPILIALEAVDELRTLELGDEEIRIGAGLNLSELEHRLDGALPLLDELFPLFSSRLIRNRATLGGNLVNASPIGDSPPALLALDARVVLASQRGERELPLVEFFTGYRQTALAPGELLRAVIVPRRAPTHAHFYKVSKRVLDDISTVAAAFAVDLDPGTNTVTRARLAYGGVAATPVRAQAVEQALVGRPWAAETVAELAPQLRESFTPLSDHRGSAAYRQAMLARTFEKFFHETQAGRRLGPQPPPSVVLPVLPPRPQKGANA